MGRACSFQFDAYSVCPGIRLGYLDRVTRVRTMASRRSVISRELYAGRATGERHLMRLQALRREMAPRFAWQILPACRSCREPHGRGGVQPLQKRVLSFSQRRRKRHGIA